MILYLSVIGIAVAILSVINIAMGATVWGLNSWWSILIISGCAVAEFCIDGICAYLIHELPDRWFDTNKKMFKVGKKERKFYDYLHIKNWKDKVWELGGMGGFRKNKIKDANDPEYLKQFIIESNKGIIIHFAGLIVGFVLLFIIPYEYILTISLPVCIVNLVLNILPIFVLRYNIPKLEVAMERARRNKLKEEKEILTHKLESLAESEMKENVG